MQQGDGQTRQAVDAFYKEVRILKDPQQRRPGNDGDGQPEFFSPGSVHRQPEKVKKQDGSLVL